MARLIDLAEEPEVDPKSELGGELAGASQQDDRPNPNVGAFSATLSRYPIVSQLAGYLDLNTLHELSRTCRQFRANLLQYRTLLIAQALRCDNESANPALRLGDALHASHRAWTAYGNGGARVGRITSGKVGACARDLVGNCRKCQKVVCRNCIIKAPPVATLNARHRRLCRTCMKSPLDRLTFITKPLPSAEDEDGSPGTIDMAHTPCTCAEHVWICRPCGQALRPADTTYQRGWAWRTRYSSCGGFGAGLGEGNEGVECGRNGDCLAVREVEHEVECDYDDLESSGANVDGHHWKKGSSYTMQETVGIGGRVRQKVKKRVKVGAIVKEYEDERISGNFLAREQCGSNRSWCSWCERVVTGKKDLEAPAKSSDSIASSSSTASA